MKEKTDPALTDVLAGVDFAVAQVRPRLLAMCLLADVLLLDTIQVSRPLLVVAAGRSI